MFFKFVKKEKTSKKKKVGEKLESLRNLAQIRRESEACLLKLARVRGLLVEISANPRIRNLRNLRKSEESEFWVPKRGAKRGFLGKKCKKNFVPSLLTPKRSEGGGKKSGALLRPLV